MVNAFPLKIWERALAVTVFVWKPHAGQVGHAAVEVKSSSGSTYISWWPNEREKLQEYGKPISVFWGVSGTRFTFAQDMQGEGGRPPLRVNIKSLRENDIVEWWRKFPIRNRHWSLLNTNCALVSANALRAGGGSDTLKTWEAWFSSWNTVWTPMDVYRYAMQIKASLD